MNIQPRRILTIVDDLYVEGATWVEVPLRKVAIVALVENPFAGRPGQDLTGMIEASPDLGRLMGERLKQALGPFEVQSYGKGGVVGLLGEQEHANALLTTIFANPIRDIIGGGQAWISSFTKVAAPGALIDIPMNHKDDVYVRSHYDGMSIMVPGGPLPDEIAIIFCAGSRGRLNARVGGLTHEEVLGRETVKQN